MKIRYVSQLFQPTVTIPKNAKIKNTEITCKSQKLLYECGLVRPTSSGLFSLLPLARRAVDKLEALVRECVEEADAQRVSLPLLTAEGLWEKTGRLENVGVELLRIRDRHGKKFILSPTHEEAIADLLADVGPLSYKQLPTLLYQITNKYRDELRPKHGLLRAREFTMLDAYGAHSDDACARAVYAVMCGAYDKVFKKLGLTVWRVEAPPGDMGGSLSHEWQLPAESGEDEIDVCASCSHAALAGEGCGCGRETDRVKSIEVGHTFILGTKYSGPLGAHYVPQAGPPRPLVMSCYGIGITRLLAASLEALSSETRLRWPRAIAPYSAIVIGPKEGSREWSSRGWRHMEARLALRPRSDVIVDDRHSLTIGKRMMLADKIGYPTIIVCGKSALDDPAKYEVYVDGDPRLMTLDELVIFLDTKTEDDSQWNDNKYIVN